MGGPHRRPLRDRQHRRLQGRRARAALREGGCPGAPGDDGVRGALRRAGHAGRPLRRTRGHGHVGRVVRRGNAREDRRAGGSRGDRARDGRHALPARPRPRRRSRHRARARRAWTGARGAGDASADVGSPGHATQRRRPRDARARHAGRTGPWRGRVGRGGHGPHGGARGHLAAATFCSDPRAQAGMAARLPAGAPRSRRTWSACGSS